MHGMSLNQYIVVMLNKFSFMLWYFSFENRIIIRINKFMHNSNLFLIESKNLLD